jgi:hypothetical protein
MFAFESSESGESVALSELERMDEGDSVLDPVGPCSSPDPLGGTPAPQKTAVVPPVQELGAPPSSPSVLRKGKPMPRKPSGKDPVAGQVNSLVGKGVRGRPSKLKKHAVPAPPNVTPQRASQPSVTTEQSGQSTAIIAPETASAKEPVRQRKAAVPKALDKPSTILQARVSAPPASSNQAVTRPVLENTGTASQVEIAGPSNVKPSHPVSATGAHHASSAAETPAMAHNMDESAAPLKKKRGRPPKAKIVVSVENAEHEVGTEMNGGKSASTADRGVASRRFVTDATNSSQPMPTKQDGSPLDRSVTRNTPRTNLDTSYKPAGTVFSAGTGHADLSKTPAKSAAKAPDAGLHPEAPGATPSSIVGGVTTSPLVKIKTTPTGNGANCKKQVRVRNADGKFTNVVVLTSEAAATKSASLGALKTVQKRSGVKGAKKARELRVAPSDSSPLERGILESNMSSGTRKGKPPKAKQAGALGQHSLIETGNLSGTENGCIVQGSTGSSRRNAQGNASSGGDDSELRPPAELPTRQLQTARKGSNRKSMLGKQDGLTRDAVVEKGRDVDLALEESASGVDSSSYAVTQHMQLAMSAKNVGKNGTTNNDQSDEIDLHQDTYGNLPTAEFAIGMSSYPGPDVAHVEKELLRASMAQTAIPTGTLKRARSTDVEASPPKRLRNDSDGFGIRQTRLSLASFQPLETNLLGTPMPLALRNVIQLCFEAEAAAAFADLSAAYKNAQNIFNTRIAKAYEVALSKASAILGSPSGQGPDIIQDGTVGHTSPQLDKNCLSESLEGSAKVGNAAYPNQLLSAGADGSDDPILHVLALGGAALTAAELADHVGKDKRNVVARLRHLLEIGKVKVSDVIAGTGSPTNRYSLNLES